MTDYYIISIRDDRFGLNIACNDVKEVMKQLKDLLTRYDKDKILVQPVKA